jgi:HAD superfamily hydrolase (TIGR01459 family)
MSKIVNIFDIIDNYDVFLFDIWGVLMEQNPYLEVIEAIKKINKIKDTYIVTNMGRTRGTVKQKLLEVGLDIDLHKIFTAGESARSLIKNKVLHPNPVLYHFDDIFNEVPIHEELIEGIDIKITRNIEEANLMLISQYVDDISDTARFDAELKRALDKGLIAICSNPDTIVVNEGNIRYCAGFFAEKYQNMGGTVHYAGKPHLNIYDEVFSSAEHIKNIEKNRIIMIGDTLETDILGAKNANIHSALVTTGNMKKLYKDIENADKYEILIKNAESVNLSPNWIIEIK